MDRRGHRLRKKQALKIAINLIIIISWVVMMCLLIKKEGILKSRGTESSFRELIPRDIEVDAWKSLYISDQWAGYVHTTMGPYQEREREGFLINGVSYLRFNMFEQLKEIEINTVQVLDTAFRVLKFEARISGMARIIITGKRLGDHLLVEIMHNRSKYRKVFEGEDDFFLENSILSIYRGKGLKKGDSYNLNLFNPLTLTAEPTRVEVIEKEGDLFVLETKYAGLSSRSWVGREGQVVREETANGWVMKLETKEEIEAYLKENLGHGVDILRDAAVITRRKLKNPRELDYLKLRVSGIDMTDFPMDGQRQSLLDETGGIVEIRALSPDMEEVMTLPYEGRELREYLKPSIWIQCRDPKLRSKAIEIIGDETNSWEAVKRLSKWVHENVEKSFSVGIPVATSVLVNREGDCNEHTVLFVALARACGIPTEMSAGFVYLEDGFYYHAWPKAYVGKWVHVDPTFGQFIADATHFELVSGDFSAQTKLALTMGKIHMEILEAEVRRESIDQD